MKRGFLLVNLFLILSLFMVISVSSAVCLPSESSGDPDNIGDDIGDKYYFRVGFGSDSDSSCDCDIDLSEDCDPLEDEPAADESVGIFCSDYFGDPYVDDPIEYEVRVCSALVCNDPSPTNDPIVKEYVETGNAGDTTFSKTYDSCDGNSVREYSCDGNQKKAELFNCLDFGSAYQCQNGECVRPIVLETACSDSDGGVNYFTGGNTTLDDEVTFSEDFCVDGNTLTEYSCSADGESIIDQLFDCDCVEDDDGFGYCDIGDDLVCEAANTISDPQVIESLGTDIDLVLTLELPKNPVGSRSNNLDSSITDLNSYYCGLDLKWHITKPILSNLNCIEAGENCAKPAFRSLNGYNRNQDNEPFVEPETDENFIVSGLSAIACFDGEGCPEINAFHQLVATECLEDYECQANSCLEGHCISISSELKAQRGILIQMWCAITTLPTFVAGDREGDNGPFDDCMLNSFSGGE